MAANITSTDQAAYRTLTDLPGIGPTKAKWLKAAGIDSIEALCGASTEDLAHVRGIGRVLAVRLRELVGAAPDPEAEPAPSADLSDSQIIWQDNMSALVLAVEQMIENLQANTDPHGLKPKFVKELCRVSELLGEVPLSDPPTDTGHRAKISKHTKAIRALLESATKLDEKGKTHQKVVRQKLRARRKKLGKWV